MMKKDRILVEIDEDLQDIVPEFLESRQKDLISLRRSLPDRDYETIRVIGHSMKGSGGGYGFLKITEIGREMEQAPNARDFEAVQRFIDELADYLERVEIRYQ